MSRGYRFDFKEGLEGHDDLAEVLDRWNAELEHVQSDKYVTDVLREVARKHNREPLSIVEERLADTARPLDEERHKLQPKAPSIAPWLGKAFVTRLETVARACKQCCYEDNMLRPVQSVVERSEAFGDMTKILRGRLGLQKTSPYSFTDGKDSAARRFASFQYVDFTGIINYGFRDELNRSCNRVFSKAVDLSDINSLKHMDSLAICTAFVIKHDGVAKKAQTDAKNYTDKLFFRMSMIPDAAKAYKTMDKIPPFREPEDMEPYTKGIFNRALTAFSVTAQRGEATLQERAMAQIREDALTIMDEICANAEASAAQLKELVAADRAQLGLFEINEDDSGPRP